MLRLLRIAPQITKVNRLFSTLPDDVYRKRLLYRSKQRGFLELDVLMGGFAQEYVPTMNSQQLQAWEEILKEENPDMFKWLMGMKPAPEIYKDNELFKQLCEYSRKPNPKRTIFDEE